MSWDKVNIYRCLAAVFCCFALCIASDCRSEKTLRIRDLRDGQIATVKGRSGQILESEERPGVRAYTLRDDYGDMAVVLTKRHYPIMGVTLLVTGQVRIDTDSGNVYIFETKRVQVFDPNRWRIWWAIITVAILLIVGLVYFRLRGRTAELPPAWGVAQVMSGPDQGARFFLRGDNIIVGRGQDPALGIALNDDQVSRTHGRVFREGNQVFYEDTNSTNGSFVNEQRANPNQPIRINPGVLIRLGPSTVIRLGEPMPETGTRLAGQEGPGSWGIAETNLDEP